MKTVINNNERVFQVQATNGTIFCNTSDLNTVCKDLRQGYFKIYYFFDSKRIKLTKKNLKSFLEGYGLKQEFLY